MVLITTLQRMGNHLVTNKMIILATFFTGKENDEVNVRPLMSLPPTIARRPLPPHQLCLPLIRRLC
jgi:hypothetical protein